MGKGKFIDTFGVSATYGGGDVPSINAQRPLDALLIHAVKVDFGRLKVEVHVEWQTGIQFIDDLRHGLVINRCTLNHHAQHPEYKYVKDKIAQVKE